MTLALLVIFGICLLATAAIALDEVRDERLEHERSDHHGAKNSWSEVARELDLEMGPFTEETPSLRGSINEHWVSVFPDVFGTHIEVSYRSGVGAFEVTPAEGANLNSNRLVRTGDEAFDAELAVFTRSPEDVQNYFTPARRNAMLWLYSSFEIDQITNEKLNVRLRSRLWKPSELVTGIQLVVDVAGILQYGEKVFMTPPVQESVPEENGFAELTEELEERDGKEGTFLRVL